MAVINAEWVKKLLWQINFGIVYAVGTRSNMNLKTDCWVWHVEVAVLPDRKGHIGVKLWDRSFHEPLKLQR